MATGASIIFETKHQLPHYLGFESGIHKHAYVYIAYIVFVDNSENNTQALFFCVLKIRIFTQNLINCYIKKNEEMVHTFKHDYG